MSHLGRKATLLTLIVLAALVVPACGGGSAGQTDGLSGDILIDGSSTVYPITTAVAEEFNAIQPRVRISVGLSGTGGGFKKFCFGETDISDASRPIKDSEKEVCEQNGIEYVEFLVAYDGLSVMVNPANDFVECLTVEQLGTIMRPDSTVTTWADVDPAWPAETIQLFVPDPDSGTRDYFIEAVLEKGLGLDGTLLDIRQDDQTAFSSDDNVLLDGIANEPYALGFFGYAYYITSADKVKLVAVENVDGVCVQPDDTTVQDGSYNPLSRPLFIYVNMESLKTRPQVAEFVKFYFSDAGAPFVMSDVSYNLPPEGTFEANLQQLLGILGN